MIVALPILIPFISAIVLMFFHGRKTLRNSIGVAGAFLQLAAAVWLIWEVKMQGVQVMSAGNWPAPYGIVLVVDLFSAIMLFISGVMALIISVFAIKGIDNKRHNYRFYFFFHLMLMGVNGAFTTGDVFNLYVWFEVMLMASFVLMALGNHREQLRGSVKYITLNLLSSFFLLASIGLLYGKTGTLNMADLADFFRNGKGAEVDTITALFFIALAIKSALFPFYFWLPASYHTPPAAISAFFSGLLTKVGVYVLIRFFTLIFVQSHDLWHPMLLVIAGFTMFIGVISAASQMDIRRILSFHIISQIGYMIMGLGIYTTLSLAGAIYFIAHNVFAKANTFLVGGLINRLQGSYNLRLVGGLINLRPGLATLFFIPALALAGVPPLSGFFGKFVLIKAAFVEENFIIATIALIVSLITFYSMLKIWNKAFWSKPPSGEKEMVHVKNLPTSQIIPPVMLAFLSVGMGIGVFWVFDLCYAAAEQLMDPEVYINSVL
jgi:multicomponent Na+:H+ antiporter subunit D